MLAVPRLQLPVVAEGTDGDARWQGAAKVGAVAAEAGVQDGDLDALAAEAGGVPAVNPQEVQVLRSVPGGRPRCRRDARLRRRLLGRRDRGRARVGRAVVEQAEHGSAGQQRQQAADQGRWGGGGEGVPRHGECSGLADARRSGRP